MANQKWAGVIGSPIKHSLSPAMHLVAYQDLGKELDYPAFDVTVDQIDQFMQRPELNDCVGLSVTMPLKQAVIKHCDHLDGLAKAVGAVNTLVFGPQGTITGFNTDVYGLVEATREICGVDYRPQKVAIVGARASASSALAAMGQLRPDEVITVARRVSGAGNIMQAGTRLGITPRYVPLSQEEQAREELISADLIISTVPCHTLDHIYQDLDLRPQQVCFDIVYDPWPTSLAARAYERGATVVPGWLMLLHQAVMQVKLFTSCDPDVELMRKALVDGIESRQK